MRPIHFHAQSLIALLRRQRVASMPEMLAALGFPSRRTVVRKLCEVPHITSYSHRGGFYALHETARFDQHGLWCFRGIHFSAHGTLLATAEHFACQAGSGFLVAELDALLGVATTDALRKLTGNHRLTRVKLGDRFLYLSPEAPRAQRQTLARQASAPPPVTVAAASPTPPAALPGQADTPPQLPTARPATPTAPATDPQLADARQLYLSTLDEQQRRLFAGLAALEHGRGGDSRVAVQLGIHPATVARGRRELLAGDVLLNRTRRLGGGRKPLLKKSPH